MCEVILPVLPVPGKPSSPCLFEPGSACLADQAHEDEGGPQTDGLSEQPAGKGAEGAGAPAHESVAAQHTWWLDNPFGQLGPDASATLLDTFQTEVRRAGSDSIQWSNRFMLHLSPQDVTELEARLLAVIDEYVSTDDQRRHHPAHGGIIALHQLDE